MLTKPQRLAVIPRRFDGTNNAWLEGAIARGAPLNSIPFTVCAYILPTARPTGDFGPLYNKADSATTFGARLAVRDTGTGPHISMGGSSTGTAGQPYASSALNSLVYGKRYFVAGTWSGGVAHATSCAIYIAEDGTDVGQPTTHPHTSADGSGSGVDTGASFNFVIGSSISGVYRFIGDIYFVAKWNRELQPGEIQLVQKCGPQAVPGYTLLWVNGVDIGPYHFQHTNSAVNIKFPNSSPCPSITSCPPFYTGRRAQWVPDALGAASYTDPGETWSAAGTNAIAGNASISFANGGLSSEGTVAVDGSMGYVDPGENWVISSQTLLEFNWTDPGESWDMTGTPQITGNAARETLTRATTRGGREAMRAASSAARSTLSGSGGTVRETIRDTNVGT